MPISQRICRFVHLSSNSFFLQETTNCMQLLVSVRSTKEADLVGPSGVDLMDLKEPNLGSLGAASPDLWEAVVSRWHGRIPISIALGELPHAADIARIPPQTDRVKVGLAGCRQIAHWQSELGAIYDQLPAQVQRVAVYYADAHLADSPPLEDVLQMAIDLRCQTFLVDTYSKSGRSVFDYLSTTQLTKLRQQLHANDLHFALAGSLRAQHLPSVVKIQPDIVAVRGVVCHRDRTGEIDADRLRSYHRKLAVALRDDTRPLLAGG
ncbi:(5-formylfuran-3-yl)methyl phosphate synthase [Bremerella sp. JC770]|uniref:(5-formylfuran-3-yl)methyl phosphate synthase n=1 Tax=Bremerella sp. JC770 TaxID=3232137 RepID=UPI00345AD197